MFESRQHVGRRHHTPYLDVMTVQSRQYIAQQDIIEEDHSKLLVEPIHIPDLKHTGIQLHPTQSSTPMFYPNGMKNVHLRQVIKETLSFSGMPSVHAFPMDSNTATVTLQPSISCDSLPSVKLRKGDHGFDSPKSIKKSTPKKNQRVYVYRELDKAKEREMKELLSSVRQNTNKIAGLVNPHST